MKNRIENTGIIISSVAAVLTLVLGGITIHQGNKLNSLRSDFEQEILFSETLANAIEHLSSDNQITKRMAVVSLANSAKEEEQIVEAVKVIILSSNSELSSDENQTPNTETNKNNTSYNLLIELAALNAEKGAKYKAAINNEEIKKMLGLFPPIKLSNEKEPIKGGNAGESGNVSTDDLESQTRQIIVSKIAELVKQIYTTDGVKRRSAVDELSKNQWRSYDETVVHEILDEFNNNKETSEKYFGIVNSLFVLNKVDDQYLKNNKEEITKLINSGEKILNQNDKNKYITPIKERLKIIK